MHRVFRAQEIWLEQGIIGIDISLAINQDRVAIVVGLKRWRGHAPDPGFVFLHSDRLRSLAFELHLLSIDGAKADGHAVVGVNFRGGQRRWRSWRRRSCLLGFLREQCARAKSGKNQCGGNIHQAVSSIGKRHNCTSVACPRRRHRERIKETAGNYFPEATSIRTSAR